MKFPKEIIIRFEADAKGTTVTAMDGGELIRCKDCVHYQGLVKGVYCTIHSWDTGEDSYCSYGERIAE